MENTTSLGKGLKFPKEKGTFPRNNVLSLMERPKFLGGNIHSKSFCNWSSYFYFYKLFTTYHWKALKESYNFVGGNTSIKIYMQKLWSNKNSNTLFLRGNLNSFSLGDMIVPQGKKVWTIPWSNLNSFSLRTWLFFKEKPISLGCNELSLGKFPKEHMFWIFMQSYFIFVFIEIYDLLLERSKGELQLCNWKHINQNPNAKVIIKQIFRHICSLNDMVVHWNNLSSFSSRTSWLFLGEKPTSLKKDELHPRKDASSLQKHMFWIF